MTTLSSEKVSEKVPEKPQEESQEMSPEMSQETPSEKSPEMSPEKSPEESPEKSPEKATKKSPEEPPQDAASEKPTYADIAKRISPQSKQLVSKIQESVHQKEATNSRISTQGIPHVKHENDEKLKRGFSKVGATSRCHEGREIGGAVNENSWVTVPGDFVPSWKGQSPMTMENRGTNEPTSVRQSVKPQYIKKVKLNDHKPRKNNPKYYKKNGSTNFVDTFPNLDEQNGPLQTEISEHSMGVVKKTFELGSKMKETVLASVKLMKKKYNKLTGQKTEILPTTMPAGVRRNSPRGSFKKTRKCNPLVFLATGFAAVMLVSFVITASFNENDFNGAIQRNTKSDEESNVEEGQMEELSRSEMEKLLKPELYKNVTRLALVRDKNEEKTGSFMVSLQDYSSPKKKTEVVNYYFVEYSPNGCYGFGKSIFWVFKPGMLKMKRIKKGEKENFYRITGIFRLHNTEKYKLYGQNDILYIKNEGSGSDFVGYLKKLKKKSIPKRWNSYL